MKIRIALASLLLTICGGFFLKQPDSVMAQSQNSNVTLRFAKESVSKENETYTLPIYLNTKGQNISAVEIKIKASSVDLLSLKTSSEMKIQEIFSYTKDGEAYVSLTATNITAGISNNKEQEVALLKFITFDDKPVTFSLDPNETMVVSSTTDDNVLTAFDSFSFTGEVAGEDMGEGSAQTSPESSPNSLPQAEQEAVVAEETIDTQDTVVAEETAAAEKTPTVANAEDSARAAEPESNTGILILIIALLSVIIIGGGLFFFIKSKKQMRSEVSQSNNMTAAPQSIQFTPPANMPPTIVPPTAAQPTTMPPSIESQSDILNQPKIS